MIRQMPFIFAVFLASIVATGCAHHRLGGNGYSYQPPLAPAVYPQPPENTQPIAPVVTTGVPPVGQPVVMQQPVAGQPIYAPEFGALQTVPCDPNTPGGMTAPIQTQPCPPAL